MRKYIDTQYFRKNNLMFAKYIIKPFTITFEIATGQVDWGTAQSLCLTRYDSQLIPGSYIEEHNLTGDIIEELKTGASAWIDGKTQNMGCYQGIP